MKTILKNHLAIEKDRYQLNVLSGLFKTQWEALNIQEIEPDYDVFKSMLDLVSSEWHWNRKSIYTETALRQRLAHPDTRLFMLQDGEDNIGYSLVVSCDGPALKDRFWKASGDKRVVEIENLALFPGQEGRGRGQAFFEMLFADLFTEYDAVYWSMSSSNYPTLLDFYKRMGMTLLAQDVVEDFRPNETELISTAMACIQPSIES